MCNSGNGINVGDNVAETEEYRRCMDGKRITGVVTSIEKMKSRDNYYVATIKTSSGCIETIDTGWLVIKGNNECHCCCNHHRRQHYRGRRYNDC